MKHGTWAKLAPKNQKLTTINVLYMAHMLSYVYTSFIILYHMPFNTPFNTNTHTNIYIYNYIYVHIYVPAHMDAHIWQDSTSSTNVSCIQFASHGCSTHHIPDCKASLCLSSSLAASSSARSCSSHSPCRAPGIGWVWLLRRTEVLTHSRHGPSTSQKDRTYHSSSQSNDTKYHQPQWYPTELMWCARTLVIGDSLSRSR